MESNIFKEDEKRDFNKIINREAELVLLTASIKNLTNYLYKYYNKKVILLIDEYDVPIQEAYLHRYYDDMISLIRNMLSDVLKDNIYLEKAMITGILRVAKESIFSGLNNLEVNTILGYDVMIIPKDINKIGIIIEFKKIDDFLEDTIEEGIKKALKKIEDNKYETELLGKGIKDIVKLAIVFKGKEVKITEGK